MLRRDWRVWIIAGLTIAPYGDTSQLLSRENPWRAFRVDDPILVSIRVQSVPASDCRKWIQALVDERRGIAPISLSSDEKSQAWGPWLPLDKSERDAIRGCESLPCDVKLDQGETAEMKKTSREEREAKFLSLIYARMKDYDAADRARAFEFAGPVADPWSVLEKAGLKSGLALPSAKVYGTRALDFKESRMRPIRQVVDRRTSVSADGKEASVWVRALYDAHYFDSWGEWGNVRCSTDGKEVNVTFALSIELDLLKKTDFWSGLAKGSMRDAVQRLSRAYENQWFENLERAK